MEIPCEVPCLKRRRRYKMSTSDIIVQTANVPAVETPNIMLHSEIVLSAETQIHSLQIKSNIDAKYWLVLRMA